MAGFDDDYGFAEFVHEQILGPLYAALSSAHTTVIRLPYDYRFPSRGDVIIQRPGMPDLYLEEKASRPPPEGRQHDYFLLELDAPGEPSLRSLKFNDILVFAMFHGLYVDVYFLSARALSDWVFLNVRSCTVRRLFFPNGKDVVVVMIPIAKVVQDLGSSALLYRVNLGCRTADYFGGGGLGEGCCGVCFSLRRDK